MDISSDEDDNMNEGLVLAFGCETFETTETKQEKQRVGNGISDGKLQQKLQHPPAEESKQIAIMFDNSDVTAHFLHNLRQASVTYRNSFDLTDETPVYHRVQRLAPNHYEIVRDETETILKAGIIMPVTSAWFFPIAIGRTRTEIPGPL